MQPRSNLPRQTSRRSSFALVACILFGIVCLATSAPAQWRSKLYPSTWTPGFKDAQGRFLHDFSYAGYHRGERAIPTVIPGPRVDVTKAPYNADKSGASDATKAIQDAVGRVSRRSHGSRHERLLGASFFQQVLNLSTGSNAVGLILTNAGEASIGEL